MKSKLALVLLAVITLAQASPNSPDGSAKQLGTSDPVSQPSSSLRSEAVALDANIQTKQPSSDPQLQRSTVPPSSTPLSGLQKINVLNASNGSDPTTNQVQAPPTSVDVHIPQQLQSKTPEISNSQISATSSGTSVPVIQLSNDDVVAPIV